MLFHEVMPAVASGQADLGLIIHEGRFTYAQHGLHLVQDLGTHWEVQTGLPIPLGGIVARKSLGEAVIRQFETDLRASIVFARQNPKFSQPYVRAHAQEMDPSVMQAHIDLYVNSFSERLGEEGWAAVERLLVVAEQLKQQVAG
jgi:1,4-dihydroxy-6-naphthoate synthase